MSRLSFLFSMAILLVLSIWQSSSAVVTKTTTDSAFGNSILTIRGGKQKTAATGKKTKIKVAKIEKDKHEAADKLQSEIDEDSPHSSGRMSDIQFQLLSTGLYFAGNRAVKLIDFTNSFTLRICRSIFCLYIIAIQFLMSYLKKIVEKKNDESLVVMTSPLAGMQVPGMPAITAKTQTVKQYDIAEITKMTNSNLFEVISAAYMHLVNKAGGPLLLVPLMGVLNKYRSPLIQVHLFNKRAVGPFARPFKSGLEAIVGSFTKRAATATATATDAGGTTGSAETQVAKDEVTDTISKKEDDSKEKNDDKPNTDDKEEEGDDEEDADIEDIGGGEQETAEEDADIDLDEVMAEIDKEVDGDTDADAGDADDKIEDEDK